MMSTELENSLADFPVDKAHMNRVHEELEKLNIATDVINKLELQLDEARRMFREIQTSWTQRLEQLSKKIGSCIEKSRPYYEAKLQARKAQEDAQKAAIRFERANSMHQVAKQQVSLTQESLDRQNPQNVDPACLEVLNHHIQRVNEAEAERLQSEEEHRQISLIVVEAATRVQQMEKDLGRNIKKSRVYFDTRVEFTKVLEQQKLLIQRLEMEIRQKKTDYTTSLRNLEKISEKIHEERQIAGIKREAGVGCETPDPPINETKHDTSIALAELEPKYSLEVPTLRDRALSAPGDPNLLDVSSNILSQHRPVSLGSGVILLAQQLTDFSWLVEDKKGRAFNFPPEETDVRYHTVPAGVKPLPTPPQTPLSPPLTPIQKGTSSLTESVSETESEKSSLGSGRESLPDMLYSHNELIEEINKSADRAKRLSESCHQRLSVDDIDRESASGDSS